MNPLDVSYSLLKVFPELSLTPVVTIILFVVEKDKFEAGVIENVLSEFDADGDDDDIWIQVLKLSDETCRVPEQDVFDVLVVMEVVSISSEKVTVMLVKLETGVAAPSDGEVEETVGAVVSITNELIFNVTLLLTLSVTVIVQSK